MDKQNKLNAKDLINVGIYTAMYLVVFFVIGMLNAFPIFYPISLFVSPLITGVPFMLFTTKIKKSGMIFIMAVILGVFWFVMGYTWLPFVTYCISSILAELIFRAAKFQKFNLLMVGYATFSCGMIGCQLPMWVMADTYLAQVESEMGTQYLNELTRYMPPWMAFVGLILIFIGGLCGAFLGKKMLKKHFKRAGIV